MMKQHSPRFLKIVNQAKRDVKEIQVCDIPKHAILLDVREESEFSHSHAKGSIHIGKGILERDIEKHVLDTNQLLVLYCGGGYRSALATQRLLQMGYTNVYSLAGGFRAWNAANQEIESE
jgi:rhodanese-related sulfurtransferase